MGWTYTNEDCIIADNDNRVRLSTGESGHDDNDFINASLVKVSAQPTDITNNRYIVMRHDSKFKPQDQVQPSDFINKKHVVMRVV